MKHHESEKPAVEIIKKIQRYMACEPGRKYIGLLKKLVPFDSDILDSFLAVSGIRLGIAQMHELLDVYEGKRDAGQRRSLCSIWTKILDTGNSILDEVEIHLDNLLVSRIQKEKDPVVLSTIIRSYLSRNQVRRETLKAMWQAGTGPRPEDAAVWEKLESMTEDSKERQQILLDGFRRCFGSTEWMVFTPEQKRQWETILRDFLSRHLSEASVLRGMWREAILKGKSSEVRQMGWWGISMIGAGDEKKEWQLLRVLNDRMKSLLASEMENPDALGGSHIWWKGLAILKGEPKTDRPEKMEIQGMAQWKPDCPAVYKRVLDRWQGYVKAFGRNKVKKSSGDIPPKRTALTTVLLESIGWRARFRLESEETLLEDVSRKLSDGCHPLLMKTFSEWVPENAAVRERLATVWERVFQGTFFTERVFSVAALSPELPAGQLAFMRMGTEAMVTAFFRLGIPVTRLATHLGKIYSEMWPIFWPGNVSTHLREISRLDGLTGEEVVELVETMNKAQQYLMWESQARGDPELYDIVDKTQLAVLELLRLSSRLSDPPSSNWTRKMLAEMAGAELAAWEPIRWEILAPVFNPHGDGAAKTINGDQTPQLEHFHSCLPDSLPDWLTPKMFSSGEKSQVRQMIECMRWAGPEVCRQLANNQELQNEILSWLPSEDPAPFAEPPKAVPEMAICAALAGLALSRHGDRQQRPVWWRRIFGQEPEENFIFSRDIFDCLKYAFLCEGLQEIIPKLELNAGMDTVTVMRLMRTLMTTFPEHPGTQNLLWNEIWMLIYPEVLPQKEYPMSLISSPVFMDMYSCSSRTNADAEINSDENCRCRALTGTPGLPGANRNW